MGEVAEMILDGLLDEETGEYIGDINKEIYGDEAPGFPVTHEREKTKERIKCPLCSKRVKPSGLDNHVKDVHKKN
jgi:hypothetical protein